MKSMTKIALLSLISLAALTTGVRSASAQQTGYDMWSGNTYDTSNCVGYSSCYVDGYGDVYGGNTEYNPGSYTYDDSTWYHQLY